jgi:O-antigen/teichoic acid export membrane protein
MASHRAKFGRDVLIAALATLCKSLRNLLMLPVLTHSLSPAEYGVWEQIAVGIALAVPWVSLQLQGAVIRFLPGETDRARLREGFFSVFFAVLIISSLFALVLGLCTGALHGYPRLAPFLEHYAIILFLVPLSASLNTVVSYLRAFRLMLRHSLLTLGQNFGEITLVAYVFFAGHGLGAALTALALVRGVVLLAGGAMVVIHLGLCWPRFSELGAYLRFSVPLIPNSSFYRLFDAGDRYVVSYFLGDAAVGLYAAAYTVGSFFTTLVAPLHFVLLPAMAELWNTDRLGELGEYVTHTLRFTTLIALPSLVGFALLPVPILDQLAPLAYGGAADYLPVLALSFFLFGLGIPGDHLLMTAGRTRLLLALNGGIAALNLGLNLVWVPAIGIWGAVLATLAGHSLYAGTVLYLARRILAFRIPWEDVSVYAGSALAMGAILHLVQAQFALPLPATVLTGAAVYVPLVFLLGGVSGQDLGYLASLTQRERPPAVTASPDDA